MAKYRKKPVVIDAHQLPPVQPDRAVDRQFFDWAEEVDFLDWSSGQNGSIEIKTLEGTMTAQPGDWIIKGVSGEFYPCKPDIFEKTYEAANE